MRRRILFLGGTRFFGREAVRRLGREGHDLVVLSRRPPSDMPSGARWIEGERESGRTLAAVRALAPYDVVVDNIAYRPEQVELLLDAVCRGGTRPLYVLTSSSAVYLDRFVQGPLDEGQRPPCDLSVSAAFPAEVVPYARGKIRCEEVVEASGLPYVLLRLPFVTGAGDFALRLAYFLHRLERGFLLAPPTGGWLQQVYAADLPAVFAEAVRRGGDWEAVTVNVAPPPLTLEELAALLAVGRGACRLCRLPMPQWRQVAAEFPYIYDQVLRGDAYRQWFTTRLTPMAEFLPLVAAWYRTRPELWREKYLPSQKELRLYAQWRGQQAVPSATQGAGCCVCKGGVLGGNRTNGCSGGLQAL